MRRVSVGNVLTANTKTTVYTTPSNYSAQWDMLYITNATGTNKTVSVWWYDKSKNLEITIIDSYPITAREFLKFDGTSYVILEDGDEIRIITETGSTMSCVNSFELNPANSTSSLS
tara:strand:- start:57 stop:404 length:348 start_codon:yes stop_codon:yes gene_type:complete